MKTLLTLVAAAAASLSLIAAQSAAAQKSDDVVCFFEHANFTGDRVCAPAGEQVDSLFGFNDLISSISVQNGVKVRVCTDSDLNGRCQSFDKDTPFVGNRLNDKITSYVVTRGRATPTQRPQAANTVCFYEHANHRGRRLCAAAGEVIRQVPANWKDAISSLQIKGDISVQVCERSRMRGRCREFEKDTGFVGDRWNDQISSFRVSELVEPIKPQARNSVCFFEHAKYRGKRLCANAGQADRRIGQEWNDRISSLKLRGAVSVQVCEKARFGGRCREFSRDQEFVGDRWNDKISSYRVVSSDDDIAGNSTKPQKPQAKNRACFYQHANFRGRELCVPAGDVRNQLPNRWNDKISSVRIFGDTSVTLCTRRSLAGRCQKIERNTAYIGDRWNDRISSLRARLERVGVHPVKPGQICFYGETHFRGKELCTTTAGFPQRMPTSMNNSTSSVRVPQGATVLMCDGKRMSKGCIRLDRDVEYVGDQWNNRISSFLIKTNGNVLGGPADVDEPLDGRKDASVCFYTKAKYKGRHFCANPGDDVAELNQRWNDRISSVRVGRDNAVKVCEHVGYAGRCRIYEEDTVYVGDRWNDRISSFQVRTGDVIDTITNGRPPNNGIVQHPSDQICFFKQKKYRGVRLCAGSGSVVPRMPDGWDDSIIGVRNYGRAVLQICQDPRFRGGCYTIDGSNKSLGPWNNKTSSFKVWSK